MAARQFIPDEEEQAEEIIRLLDEAGADVEGIAPAEIVDTIDASQPVSVNLRTIRETLI